MTLYDLETSQKNVLEKRPRKQGRYNLNCNSGYNAFSGCFQHIFLGFYQDVFLGRFQVVQRHFLYASIENIFWYLHKSYNYTNTKFKDISISSSTLRGSVCILYELYHNPTIYFLSRNNGAHSRCDAQAPFQDQNPPRDASLHSNTNLAKKISVNHRISLQHFVFCIHLNN